MAVDQRLLDGMERAVWTLEALDGDELLAVERRDELDARVDGTETDAVSLEFPHDDGARAAVTLSAALFGPGAAQLFAQKVEYSPRRLDVAHRDDFAVEHEPYRAAGRGLLLLLAACHAFSLPLSGIRGGYRCASLDAVPRLASAVGRVAPRRNQQRHMIVLVGSGHTETQDDVADERRVGKCASRPVEVLADAEHELVDARHEPFAVE